MSWAVQTQKLTLKKDTVNAFLEKASLQDLWQSSLCNFTNLLNYDFSQTFHFC